MIRLHIGCGAVNFGRKWIHIDKADYNHIKYNDFGRLPFDDNTVSTIYSSHAIEYFDRQEIIPILQEWHRVLKPNGIIRLAVPDFSSMVNLYVDGRFDLDSFIGPLYGKMQISGSDDFAYHRTCFDFDSLQELLLICGFHDVHRYNWRKTEHSEFDDCSQAYLPKMKKSTGALISLNVQATKSKIGFIKHGMSGSKTYRCWAGILQRCNNKTHPRYRDWGGRGIKVEDLRWNEFHHFFNDMGECPAWGSIERKNNELGYYKKNCRWSDTKQQSLNRRSNVYIDYNGRTQTIKEWATFFQMNYGTIKTRLNAGWPVEDLFSEVVSNKRLVTFNGETKTMAYWSRHLNIPFDTLWRRFKRGWTIEQSFTTPLNKTK